MSELAKRLGVPVDLIVDWESGHRFPTKKHHVALVALANETESPSEPVGSNGQPA